MADRSDVTPPDRPDGPPTRWTAGIGGQRGIPGSWISITNAVLGLGLAILGPAMQGLIGISSPPFGLWNNVVVGLLIAVSGFFGSRTASPFLNWVQALLGLWLVASPMLPVYGPGNVGFDSVVVGAPVAILGVIGGLLKISPASRRGLGL